MLLAEEEAHYSLAVASIVIGGGFAHLGLDGNSHGNGLV